MQEGLTQENSFRDALSDVWIIKFSMKDLLDGMQETGIRLKDFTEFENMNLGSLAKLAWYPCRKLARARKVSEYEFWERRITPDMLEIVLDALKAGLVEAFPTAFDSDLKDSESTAPKEPGESAISMN